MKSKVKRISKRTTMMFLLMVLTSINAWAAALIYVSYLDPTEPIGMQRKKVLNPEWVSDQNAEFGTDDTETWYYVNGTVTCSNRIDVRGTVNLILADGCNFTASEGIHVASGNALNIYAQSVANRGSLTATATGYNAAIGGNGGADQNDKGGDGENSGVIKIYGGNITTTGNIGGGNGGKGNNTSSWGGDGGNGYVTIYSGNVIVNNIGNNGNNEASSSIGGGLPGVGMDEYGLDDPTFFGLHGNGSVTLSWADASDRIYSYNYYGSVTLDKTFVDNNGNSVNNSSVGGKAIKPAGTNYTVSVSNSLSAGVTVSADLPLNGGNKYAVYGQVVTFNFTDNGVASGYLPIFTINYTNAYGDQTIDVTDNGDGIYSFWMPAADVTITAELKKDIDNCTAEVPDQLPYGNLIMYKFENANYGYAVIGETVKDGETTLVLGTDYEFGSVTFANGNPDPEDVGDECRVEIRGKGDYSGTKWAYFAIVNPSGNGTWGSLSWALSDGTLTISGTGDMVKPQNNGTYPWLTYKSYIETITIGDGVTSIADGAFATAWDDYHYAVSEVNLPSTLKSIGVDAFAYCTGATIAIPVSVTSIGSGAFTEVLKVSGSLSDNADNTELVSLLSAAKGSDVTLKGRTLKKDGSWNSLCLPFGVDGFASTPLADATVLELDVDGYYANNTRYLYNENDKKYYDGSTEYQGEVSALRQTGLNGSTVRIYFIEVTSIEAGKPYLVKWEGTSGTVENPEFTDVKVLSYAPADKAATSSDGKVKFVGSYSPYASTGSAFMKESADASAQNAFRAFVKVNSEETIYSNQACTEAATVLQTGTSMVYYVKNTFVLTEAAGVTGLTALSGNNNQLVSFTRSGLTANAYSTMCLPFSFKAPAACTFYAFTGIEWNSTNQQWEATISQQDANATLSAHTPYIFKCAENEATFTSTIATVAASYGDTELSAGAVTATVGDDKAWTFKGTYTALDWTSAAPEEPTYGFSTYVPYNEGNTDGIAAGTFVRFIQGASLAPFRARLIYGGTNSHLRAPIRGTSDNADLPRYIVVRIVDENGAVTYVGTVDTATGEISNDVWFTLEGKMLPSEPTESGIYIYNGHKVSINR